MTNKYFFAILFTGIYIIGETQNQFYFNAGIGYFDFLYRPEVKLNNNNSYRLTNSGQDYSHLGFLLGIHFQYKPIEKHSFHIGIDFSDRRRLVSGKPLYLQSGSIINPVNQLYSVYLDFPMEYETKIKQKLLIKGGIIPSIVLKNYFYQGQEYVTFLKYLIHSRKNQFDLSFSSTIGYQYDIGRSINLRFFYSLPKLLAISYDPKKYPIGGVQIVFSQAINWKTLKI